MSLYRWQMIKFLWLLIASMSSVVVIADERRNLMTQNAGWLNIDCGVDEDYIDETTGFYYKSDRDFVSTGKSADILPEFDKASFNFSRLSKTLRYFPEGKKNCYTLKPEQGKNNNYLIRAYFRYGNYDGKNQTPKFDLYLGVHYWSTVWLQNSNYWHYFAAVYFSPSDVISVCLVNTGLGIPSISALELRPLDNAIYRTDAGFSIAYRHYDAGYLQDEFARYKDDVYDRIWTGYICNDSTLVNTTQSLRIQSTNGSYKVPSEVLRVAVQPQNLTSLTFTTDSPFPERPFILYFHFAEVQKVPQGLKREFTITLNKVQYGPITPQYLKPLTVVSAKTQGSAIQFSINPTKESGLPPILNGFEILIEGNNNDLTTNTVDGMLHISLLADSILGFLTSSN